MTTSRLCFMVMVVQLLLLAGCKESAPPPSTAPVAPKTTAVVKPQTKAGEEVPVAVPAKYVYTPGERRDPFQPLVVVKKAVSPQDEQKPTTPLQQFEVVQFKLTGIIMGKGQPVALVVGPDGKGYLLKKGIKVGKNNGVVTSIESGRVIVEEKYKDFSDAIRTNVVEIKLPKREGV